MAKNINLTPVRYGVFVGFLIAPAFGLSVICAYCNYSFMQTLILGGINGDLAILELSTILTCFVWLILLGAFVK